MQPVSDASELNQTPGRSIAVIGGGPAGLMAAELLAQAGLRVTVYDQMASLGRKFLMAGRGGLNLTHSEDLETFLTRYGEIDPLLRAAIAAFPPAALRVWSEGLGQPTFVGTSGRVFPAAVKTSPLLRQWLRRLDALGVGVKLRHRWDGWDADGRLQFIASSQTVTVDADVAVLALGGGSWPKLGSDARWREILQQRNIDIAPLRASNCGFSAKWSEVFRRFEGQPLKNIALSFGGRRVRGEAMITRDGIEGGAIYALSSALHDAIARDGHADLVIDLAPEMAAERLTERLSWPRGKQTLSNTLRKAAHLSPVALALVRESSLMQGQNLSAMTPEQLAAAVETATIRLTGVQPIAEAISTAGGVRFSALDDGFMLRQTPGVFVAGEMLDWDAPTGGYLLQASFATGAAAARGALRWLQHQRRDQNGLTGK